MYYQFYDLFWSLVYVEISHWTVDFAKSAWCYSSLLTWHDDPFKISHPWNGISGAAVTYVLICSDLFWPILINYDSFWSVLIRFDSFWSVLIHSDLICPYQVQYVPLDPFRFFTILSDVFWSDLHCTVLWISRKARDAILFFSHAMMTP